MKEKKYIHRKVTNQSDFLTQFLYGTGVLLRTRNKQGTWPGQKDHARQSFQARSQPKINRLQIPGAEGHAWSNPSLTTSSGAPHWDHECLSPLSRTACSSEAVYIPVQEDRTL